MSSNIATLHYGGGKAWVMKPKCSCLKYVVHLCKSNISDEEFRLISELAARYNGQTVRGGFGEEHSAEHTNDGQIMTTSGQCVSSCFATVLDTRFYVGAAKAIGDFRVRHFHLDVTPIPLHGPE